MRRPIGFPQRPVSGPNKPRFANCGRPRRCCTAGVESGSVDVVSDPRLLAGLYAATFPEHRHDSFRGSRLDAGPRCLLNAAVALPLVRGIGDCEYGPRTQHGWKVASMSALERSVLLASQSRRPAARGIWRRSLGLVFSIALLHAPVAWASAAPNLLGTYSETDVCASCGGSTYNWSWQITSEDPSTGTFSGTSTGGGSGTLTGMIAGTSIEMTDARSDGYTWYPSGIVAADCSMSGSWTDNNGNSGTWQARPDSGNCGATGPTGALYVAMGDSYSAGEGADFPASPGCSWSLYQDPSGAPTNTDYLGNARCIFTPVFPPGPTDTCHRALTAYPHLVGRELQPSQWSLKFVACSGAKVSDAYATNHANAVEPAQLLALVPTAEEPSVGLVTLSFGGNDLDFAGVVTTCVNPFSKVTDCIGVDNSKLGSKPGAIGLGYDTTVGSAIDGRLVSTVDTDAQEQDRERRLLSQFEQASESRPSPGLLRQAASFSGSLSVHDRLVFLLRVIRELAPGARILVLGYPRWFDPRGNPPDGVEHFKPLEERWLNDRIDLVDAVIRDAVQQSGVAQYVGVSGAFAGHEESGTTPDWPVDASGNATCQGSGSYINGVDLVAGKLGSSPELMHPNPCGHRAFARAVEATYAQAGSDLDGVAVPNSTAVLASGQQHIATIVIPADVERETITLQSSSAGLIFYLIGPARRRPIPPIAGGPLFDTWALDPPTSGKYEVIERNENPAGSAPITASYNVSRGSAPVLPPGADIRVTRHASHFLECEETFQAHLDKAASARIASFSWYNDGGDGVSDLGPGKHDTMTLSAHSAFHFLLIVHGTNGQNRYLAYNDPVKC